MKASSANFEALYAALSGEETRPFTLDTLTMTPEPRFRQAGKTAWITRNAPSVFVSNICRMRSRGYAPVIADASGHLFGTTLNGGHLNRGVAFELAPEDIGWTFTTLYDFCQLSQCADGSGPAAPLVMDASGNLFGTTNGGGNASGQGVMFKLVPNGINSQETVLYSFCALADCTDGASPQSGLVLGANGDLFGTTANGGAHSPFGGTVFRLRGTHYKVLYSFCAESNCGDGTEIDDGLVIDASGTLFGVAAYGGAHGEGSAFQLRPARH